MKHVKTFKSILIIVVVLALAVAVLGVVGKKNPPVTNAPGTEGGINLSPEINSKQLCYMWNTEAGDKAMISMDIRAENVLGEFYWLPAQKDSKQGIFKGTITSVDQNNTRTVNAFWDTNGEGMKVTEELKIMIDGAVAHPGFGEMKDRGDGVYVYADPAKIDYSLNLEQTDCGDSAMN